jgi:hypothetical protein
MAGIFDRLFGKKKKPTEAEEYEDASEVGIPSEYDEGEYQEGYDSPRFLDMPSELEMDNKIIYNFDKMLYRLSLHNTSTDMIGDITVELKTVKNSVIKVIESEQVVEMLEPGKSINVKMKLKPSYKLGKSGVYGKIEYFDFKSKERKIFRLPQAYVQFEIPKLDSKRIDEDKWRLICSGLKNFEVETNIIDSPPEKVFDVFKNVLNNMGLFMLPPIENINLYRGVAKFYGFDSKDNNYTAEAQVIGDKKSSKVLFRIWSTNPKSAMALGYKALDIIDGPIKIKKFIVET